MESKAHLTSKFGVEIETRIKGVEGGRDPPKAMAMERWAYNVGPLGDALASNEVANHLTADQYEKDKETYEEWYITQDDSIGIPPEVEPRILWGVELVSPVFDYQDRHSWKDKLSRVYGVLNQAPFFSDPDGTCALHVHVSIEPDWDVERVRRLAGAILHYMPRFEQLAAGVGRSGQHAEEYAMANSMKVGGGTGSGSDAPPSAEQVRAHLRSLSTIGAIADALCPKEGVPPPRHYFWNLWPLAGLGFEENEQHYYVKKTGTVEFRLPPSPRSWADAASWIDFANLFVLAAVGGGPPADNDLLLFVRSHGRRSGVPDEDLGRVEKLLSVLE